jgi:hypothetical protein
MNKAVAQQNIAGAATKYVVTKLPAHHQPEKPKGATRQVAPKPDGTVGKRLTRAQQAHKTYERQGIS